MSGEAIGSDEVLCKKDQPGRAYIAQAAPPTVLHSALPVQGLSLCRTSHQSGCCCSRRRKRKLPFRDLLFFLFYLFRSECLKLFRLAKRPERSAEPIFRVVHQKRYTHTERLLLHAIYPPQVSTRTVGLTHKRCWWAASTNPLRKCL